ncbi:hypothetical protein PF008_g20645 [Phytophthora fragariae]|uniref:RxLR effector protein n=1 Tax=Phytophthora fragariae TaxID=53985 RepID=A0A6G0QZ57_9STRA|nr:hypothetical protein PF008_g20645 [Phytophthora fragariae]
MQLGAFLLLAVSALLTCCDAVSASENVNLSLTKTTSSDIGRSLRTSETGGDRRIKDLDDEERGKEFHQAMAQWLAKLTKTSPKSKKNTFGESMANWMASLTNKRGKLIWQVCRLQVCSCSQSWQTCSLLTTTCGTATPRTTGVNTPNGSPSLEKLNELVVGIFC